MKKRMIQYKLFGCLLLTCSSSILCGNPRVFYSLTRSNFQQNIRNYPKGGQTVASNPSSKIFTSEKVKNVRKDDEKVDWVSVYQSADFDIWFELLNTHSVSDYFQGIGFSERVITRLPQLYYFRYNLIHKGNEPIKITFYDSYFTDERNRFYKPISKQDSQKRFTSSSYSWIDYNKLHRIYIEKIDSKSGGKKVYESLNKNPRKAIEILQGNNAFQVVAYPFFSLGSERYNLFLRFKIGDTAKEIKIMFYYNSSREYVLEAPKIDFSSE